MLTALLVLGLAVGVALFVWVMWLMVTPTRPQHYTPTNDEGELGEGALTVLAVSALGAWSSTATPSQGDAAGAD